MNYGLYYKEVEFNHQAMQVATNALSGDLKWIPGKIHNSLRDTRRSEIAWIGDKDLLSMLLRMIKKINRDAHWNLKITGVEAAQYGKYREGCFYDWHVDQHPKPVRGMVRKISMTLFLNEDYSGGEFDLEIYSPETDPRYKTFKLKSGSAIFFQSDQWHRVRPVISGSRESLVAWFYGPPYS